MEDVLSALTPEQEHMLLYSMKEVYQSLEKSDPRQAEALIDSLAREQDGQLLDKLL